MTMPAADSTALAALARQVYETGDFKASSEAYARAAEAFALASDRLMAAEMKNNQCVSLLRAGDPGAALEAVSGTEAEFESAGDLRRLGMALANRASAQQGLKNFPEAIRSYETAAEVLARAGEDQMRVQVMQLLSSLHLRRFKFINAVMALQSGLAGVKDPTPRQRLMKKLLFFRL
jgi:tetratricopeptide (TPR) repeat protein